MACISSNPSGAAASVPPLLITGSSLALPLVSPSDLRAFAVVSLGLVLELLARAAPAAAASVAPADGPENWPDGVGGGSCDLGMREFITC
jgi:hypothetical protein